VTTTERKVSIALWGDSITLALSDSIMLWPVESNRSRLFDVDSLWSENLMMVVK
jgi:hypothetical protein